MIRRRRAMSSLEPTRLRVRDLLGESLAGILQRPGRAILTVSGTLLGVGAISAILGLTATAGGQISKEFTVLSATQVIVKDVGEPSGPGADSTTYSFPPDGDVIVGRLAGVVHAGVRWTVYGQPPTVSNQPFAGGQRAQLDVFAVSPGYLRAIGPTMEAGVLFDSFHDDRHLNVAVLGSSAAARLGVHNLAAQPAVFVNDVPYTVVGILSDLERDPSNLLGVLIPAQTALQRYGQPHADNPASMLITTRLGAAHLVARQAPVALRPDRPDALQSVPPPDPRSLRDAVTGNLNTLFLVLAGIMLVIGAVGIANTTLVAVMERVGEIGLRRSLGARPRHIASQVLVEATFLGTVGGLIGTAIGVGVVVVVSLVARWTAVVDPVTTLLSPLLGAVTGAAAGLYPALRAARIEPLEALRR